jgi:hypothetical protein
MKRSRKRQQRSVFISYRRDDAAWAAGWLEKRFGVLMPHAKRFMDVRHIQLGEDFKWAIERALISVTTVVAVIGRQWLRDEHGTSRLDSPGDLVRYEIRRALELKKWVVPILIDNARMPSADQLPDDIDQFAYLNAYRVRAAHFCRDTEELGKLLDAGPQDHFP